jgi:hypothetical protein
VHRQIIMLAVHRLSEQTRGGGFARPTRPAEQIRMAHTILLQRIPQRGGDVILTDHIFKCLGTPF